MTSSNLKDRRSSLAVVTIRRSNGYSPRLYRTFIPHEIRMSFSVDLNNVALAHALLTNISQATIARPLFTVTHRMNWSLSHVPGPPPSFLTSTISDTAPTSKYYPVWLLITIAIFGSIISVLTVLGNILVMLAFFLDRQIRQPTNYFILSLSVSDFLIGLVSIPLLTIYIYAREWPLNSIVCDIWLSLDYTVCLTSIYTVLFITIDRFCSVKMPAKYRKWRTKKKINIMIVITWAVPTLIFFTLTMLYPHLRGVSNMQNGVCDVQWNKNQVFNLCLTIGYFWTTLFVMIVLYIFIYGVASNLEKKSQENARKMSSLVGMAGSAMTQIGVGIGVTKSPVKASSNRQNHKVDSTKAMNNDEYQQAHQRRMLNNQLSNNSSDRRHTNDALDDENSNSFESHSDIDVNSPNERKQPSNNATNTRKTRRGLSVNWGSSSATALNLTSTRNSHSRGQLNPKNASHVKSFATSLYRNPMRLSSLTSTTKTKIKLSNTPGTPTVNLTPIPSEPELSVSRAYPPPQPRPESLAIMSEELFHERLKARQSPLLTSTTVHSSLIVNDELTENLPSTSTLGPAEDLNCSNPTIAEEEMLIEIKPPSPSPPTPPFPQSQTILEQIVNNLDESSDESWRLLNSNSSLDIPYIDETDFEDLGYILHRRCVPPKDSNEPMHEETIVYKSPLYIKQKHRSKSSFVPLSGNNNENVYEIYGDHPDAHKAILESPMFDSVELITYACTNSNPSSDKLPIRHCSLRHVPREALLQSTAQSASVPLSSNDIHTTSSIIFVSKAKSSSIQTDSPLTLSPSTTRHADVERALIDFYQCSQLNNYDDNLTTSESDYKEINQETSSLLHLNERYSSAFLDDECTYQCNNNLMKMIILNKTSLETTSDERTLTNSISLNTYSQDFSVDKIFQQINVQNNWSTSTSSSSSSSQDRQIPQHLLAAIDKKRNTSSDSDAITTTTTTLTTSTLYGGLDKRKVSEELKVTEQSPVFKKHHSDMYLHDIDLSNRIESKVTFDSFLGQTSNSSSPKTKDQGVMVKIDLKQQIDYPADPLPEQVLVGNETKNGRVSMPLEGAATPGFNSAKSSVREFLQSQKSTSRRKSKSQNRARKALRTITFILGAFVVCWTPWHIYSAIHSLCASCQKNWIFTHPMFHCFYFLCYLNSPINPFCYALANQQFKKTFTRILKLDLRRL